MYQASQSSETMRHHSLKNRFRKHRPVRFLTVAAVLAAVLWATGCRKDTRLVLRVANWAGVEEIHLVDRVLREFEKRHPGVRVVQEAIPNQYREKILTSFAAGTPPDVFLLDSGDVPAFVNRDLLVDLAPYMQRVGFDPEAYFPNVLAIAQRGDALYAFPKDFTPMVVYYNRDLLQKEGVPEPQPGWTWDDFVRACLALRKDTDGDGRIDQFGTFFLRYFYQYQPFIWINGGDILSPDGSRATGYLDSPATIAAFRFLIDWHVRWNFTTPLDIQRNPTGYQKNQFYLGRVGFYFSGHWWLPELRRYVRRRRLNIGVVGLPRVPGKPYVNVMYESGWCVPKQTRHRKYAIQLAAFLASEYAQRVFGEAGLAIPAMKSVAAEIARADTTGMEAVFLREVQFARQPWGTVIEDFSSIEDMLPDIFDRVIWGGEPLEPVIRDVARKIDRLLEERRREREAVSNGK